MKVLSELEKLDKNLIHLSELYGFEASEASCLSAWKQTFLDTLWSLFSAMLPVKLREQECLLIQTLRAIKRPEVLIFAW